MITTVEATLGTQHKSILYSANCAQSFQSGVQPLVFKVKSSLARELKILVSVVRFRPGPPFINLESLFLDARYAVNTPYSVYNCG